MGELFVVAYEDGRIRMLGRVKIPEAAIPTEPPWTLEQVMDDGFIPQLPERPPIGNRT
jgi:hypothetical protein